MTSPISGNSIRPLQQNFQSKGLSRLSSQPKPQTAPEVTPPVTQGETPVNKQRVENPSPRATTTGPSKLPIAYQEIHSIAQQAGFVGLTDKDIKRAYVYGESLLADYRV